MLKESKANQHREGRKHADLPTMHRFPSFGTSCSQDAQECQLSPAEVCRPHWGPFPEPELIQYQQSQDSHRSTKLNKTTARADKKLQAGSPDGR